MRLPQRIKIRSVIRLAVVAFLLFAAKGPAGEPVLQAGEGNLHLAEHDGKLSGSFRYQLVVGHFYEWNTDPTAIPGILSELGKRTDLKATVEFKAVGLDDPQVNRNPLLIMTGNRVFKLSKEETDNLRQYLLGGGFLYADDCGGADYSFRRMIAELFPDAKLEPVTPDHPIFRESFKLAGVPKVVDLYGGPAQAFAIVKDGRPVVLYTFDTDLPCAWERYPDGSFVHVIDEAKREAAMQFGINVVLYAMRQHLGKVARPGTAVATAELPVPAPLPENAILNYPMRRQLPSNYIVAMAADDRYAWFGGFSYLPGEDEGLARYEKSTRRWRIFMDAEGILSEEVNCLALDGDKLLIGSDTWKWTKGMATFDLVTGKWSTLTTKDGLPHDRVVSIVKDDERIWIGCRLGLAVLQPGAAKVETIDDPVFPQGGPFMIGVMADKRYVWADHFTGVARLDKQTKQWTALSKLTPLIPAYALDMAHDERAAWFLAPVDEKVKLIRFDYETERFAEWKVSDDIDWNNAVSLQVTENELFVGMRENNGIYVFDTQQGVLTQHWIPKPSQSPVGYTVDKIMRDGDTVWAVLHPNGGLWRREQASKAWEQVPYRTGTPATHVLSLAKVGGKLYVGTLGGGPWYYEPGQSYWQNLNLLLQRQGQNYVYLGDHNAIRWDNIYAMAPQGALIWMGTNHGLIVHDPDKTPTGFEVIGPQGRISTGVVLANDRVWVAGTDGDVTVYDPAAKKWDDEAKWTAGAPIRSLCLWQDAFCVATAKGLFKRSIGGTQTVRIDGVDEPQDIQGVWPTAAGLWFATKGGLQLLKAPDAKPEPIKGSNAWGAIHCVQQIDDSILVGTEVGLILCDANGALRARYDRSSGLGAQDISAIQADSDYVWLGTLGGGICRIQRQSLIPGRN